MKWLKKDRGSLNLELSLLIGLVVVGVIWSLTLVGGGIYDKYMQSAAKIGGEASAEEPGDNNEPEGPPEESQVASTLSVSVAGTAASFQWEDFGILMH